MTKQRSHRMIDVLCDRRLRFFTRAQIVAAPIGAAVRRVCNHLGLAPARALAFGDGWNDLEMLEAVGLPCVMENAPEGLRARFPRRAQNNADDGVARAVEALLGQGK